MELYNLPAGWVWTTLGEACDVIMGQSPPSTTYNEEKRGLPFYQGKAEFGSIYPTPQKWCTEPTKIAFQGDVLLSVRAPVGPTNIAPHTCCVGRGLSAIRAKDNALQQYIFYFLRSIQQEWEAVATGTTFSAISGSTIRNQPLPLPPLPEQERIVGLIESHLSRIDAGVASTKRAQVALRRYKASVLNAACTGQLVPQDPTNEPAARLLERILAERRDHWETDQREKYAAQGKALPKNWQDKYPTPTTPDITDLPDLPPGWVWASLEAISNSLGGYAFKSENFGGEGYQVVKIGNVKMGEMRLQENITFIFNVEPDIAKKYVLLQNDLVITLTGTRTKQDYGYVALVTKDLPLLLNQRVARLRFNAQLLPEYGLIALQSESYRKRFFSYETGNVGQGNVGMRALTVEPIAIPPLSEQTRIVEEVERRLSVVAALEHTITATLKRATRLRQSVLRKAFRGELHH